MKLATAFFMAWGMFCAIPCPYRKWEDALRPLMLACFPLVGLLLGVLWALAAVCLELAGGLGLFGAVLLAVLPYLLNGFIHLDGFMDCCDAILSRRGLEERRRILKDSHVGSFAVICLAILLLLNVAAFYEIGPLGSRVWLLAGIPCAARCPSALAVMKLAPMDTSSYAGTFRQGVRNSHEAMVWVALAAVLAVPVLLAGRSGLCCAVAAVGGAIAIWRGVHHLQGMNGDISGLGVTVGELCGVAALIFLG